VNTFMWLIVFVLYSIGVILVGPSIVIDWYTNPATYFIAFTISGGFTAITWVIYAGKTGRL
jgi:hypothetical protein